MTQDSTVTSNTCTTNDLSFTAYLMMRGCKLASYDKIQNKYSFTLDLKDMQINRLKTEYMTSESARFDAFVRDLKKILFSGG